jgi:hypothetical protein
MQGTQAINLILFKTLYHADFGDPFKAGQSQKLDFLLKAGKSTRLNLKLPRVKWQVQILQSCIIIVCNLFAGFL